MEALEQELKNMIIQRYGNLKKFCESIDMPWTTLDSILKRGISKANIGNVMKISTALSIDVESLASGKIINKTQTIAAHKDGDNFTDEEMKKIEEFKKLIVAARPKED